MRFKDRILALDLMGALLLLSGVTVFLLAVGWGGEKHPWSNAKVWGCVLASSILMVLFCLLQWKQGDAAVIPPRILFKQRTIITSAVFSCLLSMGFHM